MEDSEKKESTTTQETEVSKINPEKSLTVLDDKIKTVELKHKKLAKVKISKKAPTQKSEEEVSTSKVSLTFSKPKQRVVFVPIVSFLIIVPYIFTVKYLIPIQYESEDASVQKGIVRLLVLLIFITYFMAVFSNPNQRTSSRKVYYNEQQESTDEDYCISCQKKKFKRSIHCNLCKTCVLLKNQHCFFIANCIGLNNTQYVVNFLFWSVYGLFSYQKIFLSCLIFYHNSVMKMKALQVLFFIFSLFLIIYFGRFLIVLLLDIYNNTTKLEKEANPNMEKNFFLNNCNEASNKEKFPNVWNRGFLSHFYYIIGPTPLHFLFPLPKGNEFVLGENSIVCKEFKQLDKFELAKVLIRKDENYKQIINDKKIEPQKYIKLCHTKYNGKIIV